MNIDGTVSEMKTLTNHGYGLEKEAMRLIKEGPKWQPAKQNGHFVRAYILQPITFQVSNGDNEQILNKT